MGAVVRALAGTASLPVGAGHLDLQDKPASSLTWFSGTCSGSRRPYFAVPAVIVVMQGQTYGSLLKAGKCLLGVTTAHDPRRTWTGDLLEAGVELDTVQRMQRKAAAQLHVIR